MPDCHKLNQRLFVVVVVVVDRKTLLFYFAKLFSLKHYVAADSAQVFVEQCQKNHWTDFVLFFVFLRQRSEWKKTNSGRTICGGTKFGTLTKFKLVGSVTFLRNNYHPFSQNLNNYFVFIMLSLKAWTSK